MSLSRRSAEPIDIAWQCAYVVTATWDDEAKVWVAESNDVPGFVTEAPTLEALQTKIRVLVPELLELNHQMPDAQ